ncbi:hypothetical protein AB6D11_00125 [Vibrio splendidus]
MKILNAFQDSEAFHLAFETVRRTLGQDSKSQMTLMSDMYSIQLQPQHCWIHVIDATDESSEAIMVVLPLHKIPQFGVIAYQIGSVDDFHKAIHDLDKHLGPFGRGVNMYRIDANSVLPQTALQLNKLGFKESGKLDDDMDIISRESSSNITELAI